MLGWPSDRLLIGADFRVSGSTPPASAEPAWRNRQTRRQSQVPVLRGGSSTLTAGTERSQVRCRLRAQALNLEDGGSSPPLGARCGCRVTPWVS